MTIEKKHFRIVLQYDGTAYHGWQVQPTGRTIQGELESVLQRVSGQPVRVTGAGRTDAGVHALGQVAGCGLETRMTAEEMQRALNSLLPPDIRVVETAEVPDSFHPRYDAVDKIYYYQLFTGPVMSPFLQPHAHHHRHPLDAGLMNEAAGHFLGRHDFTSFCAADCEVKDRVRTATAADLFQRGDLLVFVVRADGFLKQMVRTMVGTLVEVGRGKLGGDEIPRIIEARDRCEAGPTAPAHGLFLYRVNYPGS